MTRSAGGRTCEKSLTLKTSRVRSSAVPCCLAASSKSCKGNSLASVAWTGIPNAKKVNDAKPQPAPNSKTRAPGLFRKRSA
eukprot:CAMPEP_0178373446 /NCGR_PEP_ID=MMETSP0689_2-20121128/1867_1 /TAXON_ID=160604 /ORGANISM="Amphidinium massartii, Strain CS-259" /LENGTH=80 /DNA_ID=CAMNT_0019993389 /DNA_START=262 /DNA_END=504 /DNA_ORIENTATION=+